MHCSANHFGWDKKIHFLTATDRAPKRHILTSLCGLYEHKLHRAKLRLHSSGCGWSQALAVVGQRECIDWDYGVALGKGSSECSLFNLSPLRPPHLFWERQAEIWSNAECHMCVFVRGTQHLMRACWGCECVCVSNQRIHTVWVCACVRVCAYILGKCRSPGFRYLCACSVHFPSSLKGCLGYSVQVLLRGEVSSWGLSFRCN